MFNLRLTLDSNRLSHKSDRSSDLLSAVRISLKRPFNLCNVLGPIMLSWFSCPFADPLNSNNISLLASFIISALMISFCKSLVCDDCSMKREIADAIVAHETASLEAGGSPYTGYNSANRRVLDKISGVIFEAGRDNA